MKIQWPDKNRLYEWAQRLVEQLAPIYTASPIAVSPAAFVPSQDNQDWFISWLKVANSANLTSQYFYAPVFFPNGCTITKLTLYGFRNDAAAVMTLSLSRNDRENASSTLASVTADWTTDYSSGEDTSIANAVVDNETYTYAVRLNLNPNDSTGDIWLTGAEIAFQ